ncbi:MAG: glycerophosphodiester phosphodiesterase [Defluviitaleaceae bacterium]|nr:glycerophosphodiester phosphodiesterase [Defluviitaleaceae bacterium]
MKTKILAHRGASAYRPENTIPAFELAIEQKSEGFELDVHLSKDGEVVVAHDLRLERVSDGNGRICDYNLAELKKLNFSKPIPGHQPTTVPNLAEVYQLVANTDLIVNVELKTTEELYPTLPEKLVQLEKEYNMKGRVIYSSFNHYSLLAIKQLNPEAEIGLLYDLGLVDPWAYAKHVKAEAINPHYYVLMALPETVARCHQEGIKVNTWTVDDPRAIGFLLSQNVDILMTNKPDIAMGVKASMAS